MTAEQQEAKLIVNSYLGIGVEIDCSIKCGIRAVDLVIGAVGADDEEDFEAGSEEEAILKYWLDVRDEIIKLK